jgi:integrase/recombinase XerD
VNAGSDLVGGSTPAASGGAAQPAPPWQPGTVRQAGTQPDALSPASVAGQAGSVAPFDGGLAGHTAAWLWSYRESAHTRAAYQRDVADFVAWCERIGVQVLAVRRPHLDAYAASLTQVANPRTGRVLSASTIARRLAALSSWYGYLVDAGLLAHNPVARVRRPRLDRDHTATVGLSATEAAALLRAAEQDEVLGRACAEPLAGLLVQLGARVSEVCALDVTDLGHDSGHRTVRLRMKGGKTRTRAVPPRLAAAVDAYLGGRSDGPLFRTATGERVDRHTVYRFVRRAARAAGIAAADRITPHSLRHAWATVARQRGASLEERQYALGHADPRTTQRYDRARASLDRDPSYLVAGAVTSDDT